MVRYPWQRKDIQNFSNTRNIKNVSKWDYNCAGYALETFNWYCPMLRDRCIKLNDLHVCVDFMIQDFKGYLRRINDVSELQNDEYAIAFRMSDDNDFHFIKRDSGGRWRHKRGNTPFIRKMKKTEVFSDAWYGRYVGEIVLLAKKRI